MDSPRSSRSSSPSEERFLIENWTPEPLVPDVEPGKTRIITSKPGRFITIDGRECLNCGTHNYLGLADERRLEEASIKAAKKYGVGSCGPRAFYGTMDVHLELEEAIAKFLNVQEVALYSFGFSTIASAIPAYAKPTDVVFFDERCNFAIQQGIRASKSRAIKFKHNDVGDLEKKINDFHDEMQKKFGKFKPVRSFLIIESVYSQTGGMCPLKELIQVAKNYKIRLFIDESCSFGILGSTGRGITEHLGVEIQDIDLIMATLETAICGFGGFCAGSAYVVDHQRLAGTGYCFSASLPPLQCQVALEALKMISEKPSIVTTAQDLFKYAHDKLVGLSYLKNISHPLSPLKILVLDKNLSDDSGYPVIEYDKEDERILDIICRKVLDQEAIAITVSRYLVEDEMTSPIPSIKLIINASLSHADIDRVVVALDRHSL